MKRVMLLGGGLLQSYVIKKINSMGYQSVCVDRDNDAIAFQHATFQKAIDIVNQEACLQYAMEMKVDAVLTAATDYGVLTAAYIAKKMNLHGLNIQTALTVKNKYLTRKILNDGRMQFFKVENSNQINDLKGVIKFPVMVKPCDGSGSKGTSKVACFADLQTAFEKAKDNSICKKVLIESFITGQEYGVDSLVSGGEIYVMPIMQKKMTAPPIYAELGHSIPCGLDAETENRMKKKVKQAIKQLGIHTGAVNMDIILSPEGDICIVDVGARMGGNLIGSHIVPHATGMDYMAAIIDTALYGKADMKPVQKPKVVATRIFDLTPGMVLKMPDLSQFNHDKNVLDIVLKIKEGSIIKQYVTNIEGCGYVVCTGKDVTEAQWLAEHVRNYIELNTIREQRHKNDV